MNFIAKNFTAKHLLGGYAPQGDLPTDKALLKTTFKMAWPSMIESFLIAIVGIIDTIMVSSLGDYAIAAIGITTQPKFIGLAFFISINVAVSAIVARRKGEKDKVGANRVLMQALILVCILSVVIGAICVVFASPIMKFVGSNSQTHDAAVIYLQIIMGCMFFNVVSMVLNAAQRGVGNTKIAMRTNLISNGINIVFNYLLITGKFGFPRLEVMGAAIATVLGTVVAFVLSLHSVLKSGGFIHLSLDKSTVKFDRRGISSLWNIGSTTLMEQLFLRFGFLMFAMVIAKLGTLEFAAHQVGMNILSVSFSIADGLSVAAIALVGQSLGQKRIDLAKIYGSICQRIGVIFSILLAIVFFIFGKDIYKAFSDTELILKYGVTIMNLISVILFLQIAQVIYCGCLRAAGDTKFVAFVSFLCVGGIRPLIGYILCYPLGLGLVGAWSGIIFDQAARLLLTNARYRTGKWMNINI